MVGEIENEKLFHAVDWNSHFTKLTAKSSGSAETLAAGEAIEMSLILQDAYEELLGPGIHSGLIVDCIDLYKLLTTVRMLTDKSILADVRSIRYFYDVKQLKFMVWIPSSLNIADALTKLDSHLLESFRNVLAQDSSHCDFTKVKLASSTLRLG